MVGVSVYVVTVLVPELAVILIKEDMKMDNDVTARQNSAEECGPRGNATWRCVRPIPEL